MMRKFLIPLFVVLMLLVPSTAIAKPIFARQTFPLESLSDKPIADLAERNTLLAQCAASSLALAGLGEGYESYVERDSQLTKGLTIYDSVSKLNDVLGAQKALYDAAYAESQEPEWQSNLISTYGYGGECGQGTAWSGFGPVTDSSMGIAVDMSMRDEYPYGTIIEFEYNGNTCQAVVCDCGNFYRLNSDQGGRMWDLQPRVSETLGCGGGVWRVNWRVVSYG